jgi:hypothetical protein
MRLVSCCKLGIILFCGLIYTSFAVAETQENFSKANQLLFFDDHLATIQKPITLQYRFEKKGSLEKGFIDQIGLVVQKLNADGSKRIKVNYFTGDRQRHIPEFGGTTGNPLLTVFLQRDTQEMARLTEGHWRHFQKQIKLALENSAQITEIEVQIAGKPTPANKIVIYPYRDDSMKERFEEYADKQYVFTLIKNLPGTLYEIRTVVPTSKDSPLVEESLTYVETASNLQDI